MLDREARAKINRENAQKSTGPKTAAGKAISRTNALKHGLTSTTIDPIAAPGEPEGAYQERLNFWLDDMQPQNAFELSMVKRACRCDWKLDRCARYEDAAAYVRSIKDMDGVRTPGIEDKSNRERARKLGALLMFAIQTRYERKDFGPPQLKDGPDPFDDAPRDADALATFKEGVEWLIYTWKDVLPYLPCPDGAPIEGIAPEILQGGCLVSCLAIARRADQ